LHCTDGPGEWLVVPEGDSLVVTREHAKGAVAWRGPARALLLAVWGRVDPELDVIGDERVSAEWSALAP
jgi:predicted lipid carrier protein YhbT